MRHVHISFLTPLAVLFSLWIVIPLARLIAMANASKDWGAALAFSTTGF